MIESNQETFSQLRQGYSDGVIKKSEYRQFLKPNETLEESEEALKQIKEESPSTKDLIGGK